MNGHITRINVGGCTSVPCVKHIGETFTTDVEFVSDIDFNTGHCTMDGYLVDFETSVPFAPLSLKNTCAYMTCPVRRGNTSTFSQPFYVSPAYPKVLVIAKWKLFNERGDLIVCYTVPMQVAA